MGDLCLVGWEEEDGGPIRTIRLAFLRLRRIFGIFLFKPKFLWGSFFASPFPCLSHHFSRRHEISQQLFFAAKREREEPLSFKSAEGGRSR